MTGLFMGLLAGEAKWCSRCKTTKSRGDFHRNKSVGDGLQGQCIPCHKESMLRVVAARKTRTVDPYDDAEPKRCPQCREDLPRQAFRLKPNSFDGLYTYCRTCSYAHNGARRSRLRKVPPWGDKKAIAAIYKMRKVIEKMTGVKQHVHHEVPLNGELVSGLHVETNLVVITKAKNLALGNRTWPGMDWIIHTRQHEHETARG